MREEDRWKEWLVRNLTASELLNLGPTFVKHICISAGSNTATALFYNSQDDSGEIKLHLTAIQATHFGDNFHIPIYFEKGLYVALSGTSSFCIIQYKSAEEK